MRKIDKLKNLQKANILSESRYLENKVLLENRFYLETYIDGEQMLGSDGTSVLRNTSNLNKDVSSRVNTLIGLKKIKPYIGHSKSIILRLVDDSGNEVKKIDITNKVN